MTGCFIRDDRVVYMRWPDGLYVCSDKH